MVRTRRSSSSETTTVTPEPEPCAEQVGTTTPCPREVAWSAIESLFYRHGVVRHQLEGFDNFITHLLPHIINESQNLRVVDEPRGEDHVISICNVGVNRPMLTEIDGCDHPLLPHMARMRGLTYSSNIVVDVIHDIWRGSAHLERRVFREVLLCNIPVMVGSSCCHTQSESSCEECRMDSGGYFIINGVEKALVAQERLRTNWPFVFALKSHPKYQLACEIRSCHETKLRSTSTLLLYMSNTKKGEMPQMTAVLPFMQQVSIPVLALFRMLNVDNRAAVVKLIVGDTHNNITRILCSILDNDSTADMGTTELFEWLGREGTVEVTVERRQRYLQHIVSNEFLPHLGLTNDPEVLQRKASFMGYMVRRLIRVYVGEVLPDDRDHYAGKRIDPSNMGMLFRQLYRCVLKTTSIQMHKLRDQNKLRFTNMSSMLNGRRITNTFRHAFSTGTWGMQINRSASSMQTGVAQMISKMSVVATLASLRRINTPISREGKQPKPRQLHYTSWGIVCCVETPEGSSCGLIKNLAMTAHVRVGSDSTPVRRELERVCRDLVYSTSDVSDRIRATGIPVFVNGYQLGFVVDDEAAQEVVQRMRSLRRKQSIPFDTSISFVDDNLVIDTDPGCLLRPLFVGANMHKTAEIVARHPNVYTLWEELLRCNVIEYVDKLEEGTMHVGLWCDAPDDAAGYTHYELHPSMILGLCAALIPFPDHNQAPRNTYQAAMGKQAIGICAFNQSIRMDSVLHTLVEPQRPLVTTQMDRILGTSDAPSGVNVIVAIAVRKGYNQEDSVIMNRSSVERGLFSSVKYMTHRDEERANGGDNERFENPNELSDVIGLRVGNYSLLEESGVLPVGSVVNSGDAIIGKTVATSCAEGIVRGRRQTTKNDKSILSKHDTSVVDSVMRSTKPDGSRTVKVKTRVTRSPIVGDKVSSRMGQKGVVGTMLAQEDMPYTSEGIVPDIIMNPHAIPSRMTCGQLLECLLGKLSSRRGEFGDSTPFTEVGVEEIAKALEEEGFDPHGNEVMYDGCTGEPFECTVFLGPVYYQRLRHMAADKSHSRSRGPKQALTHQPLEGRARDGGLRFGEMERDCVISHGAADFLLDRLMLSSDAFDAWLCGRCGIFCLPPTRNSIVRNRRPFCRSCKSSDFCTRVCIPFACKLLMQELQGMHVGVRLLTEEGYAARGPG